MAGIRRTLMIFVAAMTMTTSIYAGDNSSKLSIGAGALYKSGLDMTVSYEHETKYHNAWEYFGNVYLKWADCESCGHICPKSFWSNYNTWGVGVAYKPCVARGRNNHGNLRIGASLGSDRSDVLGGVHVGYEHSYTVSRKVDLFWQVKSDLMIGGEDLFRTGAVIGIKFGI
jgi:hypothetical protein